MISMSSDDGIVRKLSAARMRDLLWSGDMVPSCKHGDMRTSDDGTKMVCEVCGEPAVHRSSKVARKP